MSNLTSIDLCCGAGGLSLGLEQAGFKPLLLVDTDKDCIATIKTNRPGWNIIKSDIAEIDYSQYSPELLVAGFPCQPFSYAGLGKGLEDSRGTVIYSVIKAIATAKPRMFMLENVAGLKTHNQGDTLRAIVKALTDLSYTPTVALINAADYGVPQQRKRLVISSHSLVEYLVPYPSLVTLREALKDVPQSQGSTYSKAKYSVLERIPEGCNWRSLKKDDALAYMGKMFYSGGGKTGVARRLAWDKPSPTLPCSPMQKTTELCHPSETRPLTIREYARIQTFPDDYTFSGSITSQYRQIGNAVPVKLGRVLGKACRQILGIAK